MSNFTKNNHFKFGYNDVYFNTRINATDRYSVVFGKCKTSPINWRQENIKAAQLISQTTDQPIHILYSGGIDSEVTVMSFMEAKIPFTADIMNFKYNYHDIKYAIKFCNDREIPYKIHDLDILKFWDGEMYDYAAMTHCASPQLCATMWLVDQIEGYPIIGQGECVLIKQDEKWYFRESELINSFYRHFLVKNINGVPGFHQYTSEQMLSYLEDQTFLPYMLSNSGKTSNKSLKLETYRKYFEIEERPKYTGFEHIMEYDKYHRSKLSNLYGNWTNNVLFEYEEILSLLKE